jgi:hypothetical protein
MTIKEFYNENNAVLNDSDIRNDVFLALETIANHLAFDFDFIGGECAFKNDFVKFIMQNAGDAISGIYRSFFKESADSSTDTYITVFAYDDAGKCKMMCFNAECEACKWIDDFKDYYASFKMYDFANGTTYNDNAVRELISEHYLIECQIEGHSFISFMENYHEDSSYPMRDFKQYRRDEIIDGIFLKAEYKAFGEDSAKEIFNRLASWLESEMGDAMNIKCIHDVRAHDDVVKAECIYCNDGKDIIISLRERK